jgi:hypothetical protein
VRAFKIVKMHGLSHGRYGLRLAGKQAIQEILNFEDAVYPFRQGIVVGITHGAHTGKDARLGQPFSVGRCGVLHAVVGMVNETFYRAVGLANALSKRIYGI